MTRWWCQNGLQMVSLCFFIQGSWNAVLLECCASASNSTPVSCWSRSRQQTGNQNLYKAFKHIWSKYRKRHLQNALEYHWVWGVEKPLDGRLMAPPWDFGTCSKLSTGGKWRPQIRRADPWYTHTPCPKNFTDEKGRWLIASSPWIEGSFHPSPGSAASVHIHMFYDWGWHEGRSHAIHLASNWLQAPHSRSILYYCNCCT